MRAEQAFNRLIEMDFTTVLDLGSGEGVHAEAFKLAEKKVTTVSLVKPADYVGDYLQFNLPQFDCIWASHVLEHQRNVGTFLDKCFNDLKEGGILAITVPPLKPEIVGGHLSLWNAGLLLYNLILAGFDCSNASVMTRGYNISVIVRKVKADINGLVMDFGDIEKIAHYFPLEVKHGFNGDINEVV